MEKSNDVKKPRLRINLNPKAVFYGWVEGPEHFKEKIASLFKQPETDEEWRRFAEAITEPILRRIF